MAAPPLTRASLAAAVAHLSSQDRRLAGIVAKFGSPPLWARRPGFATLARIVLEQQVSLAAAATLYRRLEHELPGGWTPRAVLTVDVKGLRARGLTRQKASYLVALAERVESGELQLPALRRASDASAVAQLTSVPGIGPWTAGIYLLMVLRRPDVWPRGDLALHKSIEALFKLRRVPTSDEAERVAARWMPYRAVAARVLWQGYLAEQAGAAAR